MFYSFINFGGRGFLSAGRAGEADELEAVGSLIHSRRPKGLQCSNPSALPVLSQDGVLLPASIDNLDRQVGLSVALAGEVGRHRRFVNSTMCDIETVAVHSIVERLSGFSHILETTPPALY